MRVISGTAGRLKIEAPKSVARPSTDRLREALFSILGSRVENARVLDLFAGSGALGIEALSRGARSAVFVDCDRHAGKAIERNLKHTRLADKGTLLLREVLPALKGLRGPFELVFADPPYTSTTQDYDHGKALFEDALLPNLVIPEGLLVLETGDQEPPELTADAPWVCEQSRHYGKSHLHFLVRRGIKND